MLADKVKTSLLITDRSNFLPQKWGMLGCDREKPCRRYSQRWGWCLDEDNAYISHIIPIN